MQNFIRPVIASIVLLYAVGGCVETVAEDAAEPAITVDDRDHWSFHPLSFSSVPPLPKQSGQCETVIDRFIAFRQESKGLEFSPLASRRQLIRRLTFDLTGLPPTESAIQNYLSDKQIGGYERLVERLLSSPAYGEHQSQFWLDLARFAETDGYEHDKIRPEAWRYRDWVIRAMNDDMPYDQFVRAQIAGDLESDSGQIATSFCLSGPDMPDINSQEERRHILLNEMTSTVGAVFLGLQVGCAQCHDHKYDPFSQADFYRLRSFFNSSVSVVKNKSVSTLSERTKDSLAGIACYAGPVTTAISPARKRRLYVAITHRNVFANSASVAILLGSTAGASILIVAKTASRRHVVGVILSRLAQLRTHRLSCQSRLRSQLVISNQHLDQRGMLVQRSHLLRRRRRRTLFRVLIGSKLAR